MSWPTLLFAAFVCGFGLAATRDLIPIFIRRFRKQHSKEQ